MEKAIRKKCWYPKTEKFSAVVLKNFIWRIIQSIQNFQDPNIVIDIESSRTKYLYVSDVNKTPDQSAWMPKS